MKKVVAVILVFGLLLPLGAPAYAASADMDKRLEAVTLTAKEILGIGDDYSDFSGELSESDPVNQWNLNWSNDDKRVRVTITEEGKIVRYYYYPEDSGNTSAGGNLLKLPTLTEESAKKTAESFLNKVLETKTESVGWSQSDTPVYLLDAAGGNYYLYGTLLINSLKTPIRVNMTVNAKNGVTRFYRSDDGQDYSSLSDPTSAVSKEAASKTLFGSVQMSLAYGLETGGSSDKTAGLRYTPKDTAYVVDALTGELINLTELYNNIYGDGGMDMDESASAKETADTADITDVERAKITELKDVLSQSTLESDARNITELGITDSYELNSVDYNVSNKSDSSLIEANLSFIATSGLNTDSYSYSRKNVTLDAKKGTLISVRSSAYSSGSEEKERKYPISQCQTIARNFANKFEPEKLPACVLAEDEQDSDDGYAVFTFQRTANGIPFPENSINVTVDTQTGFIGNYSVSWDNNLVFSDPSGALSAEAATDIYTDTAGIALSYTEIPVSGSDIYDPETELRLVYDFADDSVWGVDAISGEPLKYENENASELTYGDISSHYAADAILKLAEYGIGYPGGSFQPDKELTQKDLLTLLINACGYPLDPTSEDYENSLYQAAYSIGILEQSERNPSKQITRAELVKMVLDAAGYGETAKISGIYIVRFGDADQVPEAFYGYVAIARGLKIVSGYPGGSFYPNRTATRSEAAVMLYNYMSK